MVHGEDLILKERFVHGSDFTSRHGVSAREGGGGFQELSTTNVSLHHRNEVNQTDAQHTVILRNFVVYYLNPRLVLFLIDLTGKVLYLSRNTWQRTERIIPKPSHLRLSI